MYQFSSVAMRSKSTLINRHIILSFILHFENKKADNLSRLSAVVLSQNFRAHNIPFFVGIFFKSGLNFHLISFCKDINFKLIFKPIFQEWIRLLKSSVSFPLIHCLSLHWISCRLPYRSYR